MIQEYYALTKRKKNFNIMEKKDRNPWNFLSHSLTKASLGSLATLSRGFLFHRLTKANLGCGFSGFSTFEALEGTPERLLRNNPQPKL